MIPLLKSVDYLYIELSPPYDALLL